MILILIGICAGIISGMGIGGGTLLIPALTIIMGIEQKMAQTINLIYFIPTAIMALTNHIKNKRIEKNNLWIIIISGIIGAVIGSLIAGYVKSDLLRKLFGGFLGIMGILEILKGIKKKKDIYKLK
jgi:hypothetical protein